MADRRPFQLLRVNRPVGERGMLASTLGTLLIMLFGSAALVAGSVSFTRTLARGGDASQAREAAEWGFNTLIDQLNNPQHHYLLATRWNPEANTWAAVTADHLQGCGLDQTGVTTATRPSTVSDWQQVGGNRRIRYRLTNYVPPPFPRASQPSEPNCPNFENTFGGTGRLTVVGEVAAAGDDSTPVASFELTRLVTVEALEQAAGGGGGSLPPPLALVGTGSGASTHIAVENSVDIKTRLKFDNDNSFDYGPGDTRFPVFCMGQPENQCRGESSSLDPGFDVEELDIGEFVSSFGSRPPSPSDITLSSWPGEAITQNNTTIHYPYTSASPGTLRNNCKLVDLPTLDRQSTEKVIACKVQRIEVKNTTLQVNTDEHPVAFYVMDGNDTGEIKLEDATVINTQFNGVNLANPSGWTRFRIFDHPSAQTQIQVGMTPNQLKECENDPKKETWNFDKNTRLTGAFIWGATATVEFKEPQGTAKDKYSLFGALWACKPKYEKYVRHLTNPEAELRAALNELSQGPGTKVRRLVARGVEQSR